MLSTQTQQTMLSTEIVKIINDMREEGSAVLEHKNFMAKVVKVLGSDLAAKFLAVRIDSRGKEQPCYALPKREATLMVMSENYRVQAAVYDRMVELEGAVAKVASSKSDVTRLEMDLLFAKTLSETLRVSESGKLLMFSQIEKAHNLTPITPAYVIDAPKGVDSSKPTKALSELLKDNTLGVSAQAFNKLAFASGFLEKLTRPSSSKGEKEFWSITDKGLRFGKNITNPTNPRETQPHWYIETFAELSDLVLKGE